MEVGEAWGYNSCHNRHARNIVNAISEAGLGPQIGCFAHTINLASQKATGINQVSRVLGRIRNVVFFPPEHNSCTYIGDQAGDASSTKTHPDS